MLSAYYTRAEPGMADTADWECAYRWLLDNLPPARRERLERLRHPPGRIDSALGLLLLVHAMHRNGHGDFLLRELVFPKDGKPLCPGRCDFNISHSKTVVFCAVAADGRVGVDVEHKRRLEPGVFERMIAPEELAAAGGESSFFELWTRKEAVIKAHGGSGVWHMPEVRLGVDTARFREQTWALQSLPAPEGYAAAIACERSGATIHCEYLQARQLLHAVTAATAAL